MHNKTHDKEPLDPISTFQCSECEKMFQTKYTLTAHNKTHTKESSVECLICKKSFSHGFILQ